MNKVQRGIIAVIGFYLFLCTVSSWLLMLIVNFAPNVTAEVVNSSFWDWFQSFALVYGCLAGGLLAIFALVVIGSYVAEWVNEGK